jgi:hypothetical protein
MPPDVGGQVPEMMGGAPVATALDQQGAAPAGLPSLPLVDPGLLPNAELQQSNLGNVRQ